MKLPEFFAAIRPLMPSKRLTDIQVQRLEAVVGELARRRTPLNQAAYILATGHHESDRWRTLEEYASGAAYEGRADLGNTQRGDGKRFKGRGFVQITGRRNYTDWAGRLGVDLVGRPELAMELRHAVPILIDGMLLGTFTGKKLGRYVDDDMADFVEARRVVNGTDRAVPIAAYAGDYRRALAAAGYGSAVPAPAPTQPPRDYVPAEPIVPDDPRGFWAWLKWLFARS